MLLEQIEEDLKVALKAKNDTVVLELRTLKAALKNAEIEKKSSLNDQEVITVLSKKLKQHKDSVESFVAGNRSDLVNMEKAQMQVLEKYLPKQMSEAELSEIVKATISSLNATVKDFGKVMKEVVVKVKGSADGSVISRIVKQELK